MITVLICWFAGSLVLALLCGRALRNRPVPMRLATAKRKVA